MGPKSSDQCPYKRRCPRDTQGRIFGKTGRDWRDAVTSQGPPRIAGRPQKPGRGKEGFLPRSFWRGMALLTPWFRASSFQNGERADLSFLSHPVCGTLLRQPQETNMPSYNPELEFITYISMSLLCLKSSSHFPLLLKTPSPISWPTGGCDWAIPHYAVAGATLLLVMNLTREHGGASLQLHLHSVSLAFLLLPCFHHSFKNSYANVFPIKIIKRPLSTGFKREPYKREQDPPFWTDGEGAQGTFGGWEEGSAPWQGRGLHECRHWGTHAKLYPQYWYISLYENLKNNL